MKNKILILFALFAPLTAFCWPSIGDRAVYEGTFQNDLYNMPAKVVVKIIDYNSRRNEFTQVVETTIGPTVEVKNVVTSGSEIPTPKKCQLLINRCRYNGGVLEQVTVKAGTFQTCRRGTTNHAVVPFGMVKLDGYGFKLELSEYQSAEEELNQY